MAAAMAQVQPHPSWHSQEAPQTHTQNGRPRFQYGPPIQSTTPDIPLAPHNHVELTRDRLITVLNHFSHLLTQHFDRYAIRLVVHGGACMLLHPGLHKLSLQQQQMSPTMPARTTTRDVDYIHRSFITEMASFGVHDAAAKLKECIRGTAIQFGLGADWMNSDADIALPMAHDPSGKVYDPIYTASIQLNNIDLHTIYRSPNGMLTLISVTPFWAVSLKLVRYTKWDPGDICLLLRNGTVLSGTQWTPEMVENWLYGKCWAMGYQNFDTWKKADMRKRIVHAIQMLEGWTTAVQPMERSVSAHDAMGGGEVVGGEDGAKKGWSYSFGQWPNGSQGQVAPPPFPMPAPPPVMVPHQTAAPALANWMSPPQASSPPRNPNRSHESSPESHPRSQTNARGKEEEVFIPPGVEWVNPNHAPASHRAKNPSPPPPGDTWYAAFPAEMKNDRSAAAPWQLRADIYGLNGMDRSVAATLHYGRNANIPIPHPGAAILPPRKVRKKKEKQRKKDRERERLSKWAPRSGGGDYDTGDETSEDDENVRAKARKAYTQSLESGQAWHGYGGARNIKSHASTGSVGSGSQQPPQMRLPPQGDWTRAQHLQPDHQPSSRNSSPKHRPPPLDLSPPPIPANLTPQGQSVVPSHASQGSQQFNPAELAQKQFEQQHQQYLLQHQQQQQQQQQQYHYYQYQQQQQFNTHRPHASVGGMY